MAGVAVLTPYARVVGLDPSLRSTGMADVDRQGRLVATRAAGWSLPDAATIHARRYRIRGVALEVIEWVRRLQPSIVVVEGPSYGQKAQQGTHEVAGLWWEVVGRALDLETAVVVVPPSRLKRWATGNGAAKKPAMVAAAETRFGWAFPTNDQADAALLAAMGAHALGWITDDRPEALEALNLTTWPDDIADQLAANRQEHTP